MMEGANGFSSRSRRHFRALAAASAIALVYYFAFARYGSDALPRYGSFRTSHLSHTAGSSPSQTPTHLWSYIPGLTSDVSARIARSKAAMRLPDGSSLGPPPPVVDGFEWVKAVRRRSALTDGDVSVDLDDGIEVLLEQDGSTGPGGPGAPGGADDADGDGQAPLAQDRGTDGREVEEAEAKIGGGETGRRGLDMGTVPRRPSWGALRMQGAKGSIRANLREDMKYFTSFPIAGFTNQVMDLFTSIHLALLASRVPIVAPIIPDNGHLAGPADVLPLGDVFDLAYFVSVKETPVVEMHELKADVRSAPRSKTAIYDGEVPVDIKENGKPVWGTKGQAVRADKPQSEDIGCWSAGLAWHDSADWWGGMDPAKLHLTPLPRNVFASAWERQSIHRTASAINDLNPSVLPNHSIPYDSQLRLTERNLPLPAVLPDDQLACMDSTYYALADPERNDLGHEWRSGQGTWGAVGRYMRFQPGLVRMAQDLLREIWGLGWGEDVPVYMAVHVRRGDFDDVWKSMTQRQIAHHAWQVIKEAKLHLGVEVSRVVMTTDEEDPAWIEPFRKLGWTFVDHAKYETGEKLGYWFPTILDAVILSGAKVFLGNPASTMSILPYRRVVDWNQGLARFMNPYHEVPEGWQWTLDWDLED